MRSENGGSISQSKIPAGEMYEKWKKKSRREVTMPGMHNDDDDDRPRPNFKANRGVKDELRSADEIKKMHKDKEKNKMKNMEKGKRTKIERVNKKAKNEAAIKNKQGGTKAGSRKSMAILRY